MSGTSTLSRRSTERDIADLKRRLKAVEAIVQGQPIREARIDDISGGKVTTGTLLIKDGVDGPVISVVDSSDVEIATIDQNGIRIFDGNAYIENDSGDPVINSKGLVSEQAFAGSHVQRLADPRTTSSTTFTNIANTSIAVNVAASTWVLLLASGDFGNTITDGQVCSISVALDIDGTLYPDSTDGFGIVYTINDAVGSDVTNVIPTWHGHYLVKLPNGSHTARLKYKKEVGSVDAKVSNTMLSYLILGK